MSIGGSTSSQSSSTDSFQNRDTFIDPTQMGFFNDLWNNASTATNSYAAQQGAQGVGNSVMPGLQQGFGQTAAMGNPAAQIAAQQQSLQAGLGQRFREEINPSITTSAISAGGLGGGRQGVAQGQAVGQLGQAFTQGLGDITARANQQALASNTALGGQAQNMFAANSGQFGGGLDQLSRLAQILGNPTVLDKVRAQSSSGSSTEQSQANFGLPGF